MSPLEALEIASNIETSYEVNEGATTSSTPSLPIPRDIFNTRRLIDNNWVKPSTSPRYIPGEHIGMPQLEDMVPKSPPIYFPTATSLSEDLILSSSASANSSNSANSSSSDTKHTGNSSAIHLSSVNLSLSSNSSIHLPDSADSPYSPSQETIAVDLPPNITHDMQQWSDLQQIWLEIAASNSAYATAIVDKLLSEMISYRAYQLASLASPEPPAESNPEPDNSLIEDKPDTPPRV
jgi:hypothetical protein